MQHRFQKLRRYRPWHTILIGGFALAVLGINGVAWMQARAMTHYTSGGQRTAPPEKLSFAAKVWVMLTGVSRPRPHNHLTPRDVGLTYTTHRIELTPQNFLASWFVPAPGSRGVAVLFPPYGNSKQSLLAAAAQFHALGYDALLVDFRGVGDSSGDDTTLGVREAQDVAKATAYVHQRWAGRPVVLYGMSMGSVAILRAIAHEKVAPTAIILESPFDRLLHTVRHRFEAMGIPTFPGSELMVFWGGLQQGIDGFAHNPVDYARAVKCPTLLMHGAQDERVTVPEIQSIYANLAGKKHLAIFATAGHDLLAANAPREWRQHVQPFLQ